MARPMRALLSLGAVHPWHPWVVAAMTWAAPSLPLGIALSLASPGGMGPADRWCCVVLQLWSPLCRAASSLALACEPPGKGLQAASEVEK